jgi:hypothetical protein
MGVELISLFLYEYEKRLSVKAAFLYLSNGDYSATTSNLTSAVTAL